MMILIITITILTSTMIAYLMKPTGFLYSENVWWPGARVSKLYMCDKSNLVRYMLAQKLYATSCFVL